MEKISNIERRNNSNKKIKQLGIACLETLPVIEDSTQVSLKDIDTICKRAIACLISTQLAIDISEKMLEKLRQRDFSDHIHIIQGNFFDVDFGDDYDAVISTSALHHFLLKDKLVLYKKIYQALKISGVFLNADKIVNTDLEEEAAIEYYKFYAHEKPHIDRPLSIHHEEEILKEAGFQNISVFPVEKENYRLIRAYK